MRKWFSCLSQTKNAAISGVLLETVTFDPSDFHQLDPAVFRASGFVRIVGQGLVRAEAF